MNRFASNGQRALDLIAARCAAQSACARAFPTWRAEPARCSSPASRPNR